MFFRGNHQEEEERRQQQNERKKKQEGKVDFLIPFLLFFYRPTRPNGKKRNTEKNDYSFPSKIENNGGKSSFFSGLSFYSCFSFFALNAAAWSVRGGARLIVRVYFPRKTPKRKRRSEGGKRNWTELFVIPGHGKREKFCVMWKYFGTNIIQSFSFFPFRLLRLYSTGRLLRWNSLFLAMCLCIHETKCLSKREKANQIENHCTHREKKENKFFTSFVGWYAERGVNDLIYTQIG